MSPDTPRPVVYSQEVRPRRVRRQSHNTFPTFNWGVHVRPLQLDVLAWFAPEQIPESVPDLSSLRPLRPLRFNSEGTAEDAEGEDTLDLRESVATLADFSMLRWDAAAGRAWN